MLPSRGHHILAKRLQTPGTEFVLTAFGCDRRTGELTMKWIVGAACAVAISFGGMAGAEAKGCIKGAIVGGIAGHMAGHGKLGAAAGCAIGHHEANKPKPNNNPNAQAPAAE